MAFDEPQRGAGRALPQYGGLGGITGAVGFGWFVELVGYRPGFVALGSLLAPGRGVFWRKR
jgi:hypothetical protein